MYAILLGSVAVNLLLFFFFFKMKGRAVLAKKRRDYYEKQYRTFRELYFSEMAARDINVSREAFREAV